MVKPQKVKLLYSLTFLLSFVPPTKSTTTTGSTWIGSKYKIDCTMCSACDDPCNPPLLYSPPTSGNKYYSPPPPPPPPPPPNTANYYNYPPPQSTGSYYYFPPPPYVYYPRPPPPNPIVGYFPFYYHTPPAQLTGAGTTSLAASFQPPSSVIVQTTVTLFLGLILFSCFLD